MENCLRGSKNALYYILYISILHVLFMRIFRLSKHDNGSKPEIGSKLAKTGQDR